MDVPELHDMEISQAFAVHIGVVRGVILVLLKLPKYGWGDCTRQCLVAILALGRCIAVCGSWGLFASEDRSGVQPKLVERLDLHG